MKECQDALIQSRGHNRLEICIAHGLSYQAREIEFEDRAEVIEWIIFNQFGRRNLPAYERAKLALKLEPIIAAKAKENKVVAMAEARQSNPI